MKKVIVLMSILILLFAVTAVYADSDADPDDPFAESRARLELKEAPVRGPIIWCPTNSGSSRGEQSPICVFP